MTGQKVRMSSLCQMESLSSFLRIEFLRSVDRLKVAPSSRENSPPIWATLLEERINKQKEVSGH